MLPVEDSLESIFDAVKKTALIHQSGGGNGFPLSRLRPQDDTVQTTGGAASGPVRYAGLQHGHGGDQTRRRPPGREHGHSPGRPPDILEFISSKVENRELANFNLSVAVNEEFMRAVEADSEMSLVNPQNQVGSKRSGPERSSNGSWRWPGRPATPAWCSSTGSTGTIRAAAGRDGKHQPLRRTAPAPYEPCNLGSINLARMLRETSGRFGIDWSKLERTVRTAVHFLDNVIDMSRYPLDRMGQIEKATGRSALG